MAVKVRGSSGFSSKVMLRSGAALAAFVAGIQSGNAFAANTSVGQTPVICPGADDNLIVSNSGVPNEVGCGTDTVVVVGLANKVGDTADDTVVIGRSNEVSNAANAAVAIGRIAKVTGQNGIAIGNVATAGNAAIALGSGSTAAARFSTAIGVSANAVEDALAFGRVADAFGESSVAIGVAAKSQVDSVAIGTVAEATGQSAISIGQGSDATQSNSVAIGSVAQSTGSRSVALGAFSSDEGRSDVVAVGSAAGIKRKIINMSNGAVTNGSNEAITGGQLFATNSSLASALGAGSVVNGTTGAITGPNFTVVGGAFNNVGAALDAMDTEISKTIIYDNIGKTAATLGGIGATSSVSLRNLAAGALAANSSEAVNGSQLFATNQKVTTNSNQIAATIAGLGAGAAINGTTGAVTAPTFNVVGGTFNNVGSALGAIDVQLANALVYDNAGHTAATLGGTGASTAVSLRNLAAGALAANSTEAVNGSQLFATNQKVTTNSNQIAATIAGLGAGAAINGATGAVTAPSFNVVGSTFNNVGSALGAIDTQVAKAIIYDDAGHTAATLGGTSATSAVSLRNIASGSLAANSTEAVNGSQLFTTNQNVAANANHISATIAGLGGGASINGATGAFTGPTFAILGSSFNNVGEALAALDNELTGAVFYDDKARSRATLGGPGVSAPVSLQNVGAGALNATSTEAVNGSQLFTTNENLNALGGRMDSAESDIGNLDKGISNATIGIVQQVGGTSANGEITIGSSSGGSRLSLRGTDGDRILAGMAQGQLSATSTEAVNGAQLFATNQAVADITTDISTIDGVLGGNVTNVTNLTNAIQNGTIGLVQQDLSTLEIGVGTAVGGALVDIAGIDGTRILRGISAATLNATSTEAVNGAQLFATNQAVGINTIDIDSLKNNLGSNVTNVTNLTNAIQNGTIGLVQQDLSTLDIGVGKSVGGSLIDIAGVDGERVLVGVAQGLLAANSTEAVNGAQLFATNEAVNTNTTNIANLDNRVTDIEGTLGDNVTNVTNLTNAIQNGTIGLVQQDTVTKSIAVGANTDGNFVSFAGTAGNRVLTGVAAGSVNPASTEAVNGSQLFQTDKVANDALRNANNGLAAAAAALGGGSAFDAGTGVMTAPTYAVAGRTFNDVGSALLALDDSISSVSVAASNSVQYDDPAKSAVTLGGAGASTAVALKNVKAAALTASSSEAVNGSQLHATNLAVAANTSAIASLDTRVTNIEGSVIGSNQAVTNLTTSIQNGTIGIVQQDPATQDINVGGATGGSTVNIAGTSGSRTLRGVKAGAVSASSSEAVNGSQLYALQQTVDTGLARVDSRLSNLDTRVGAIELDLRDLRGEMNSAVASAIAIGMLPSSTNPGRFTLGMGTGVRSGQMATAFGLSYRTTDDMFTMQARAAFDKEAVSVGVGMGLEF